MFFYNTDHFSIVLVRSCYSECDFLLTHFSIMTLQFYIITRYLLLAARKPERNHGTLRVWTLNNIINLLNKLTSKAVLNI